METGPVEAHQQNNEPNDIIEIDEVEQSRDYVTIYIKEKLHEMPPIVPECSIYRVPKLLLEMNRKAYVPQVISIGPFHHDQKVFKATEELKLRFFKSYQYRVRMDIQVIVEKVRDWEKRSRRYYSEPIDMNNDDFVKMMVLDGCFIVEFMIMDCGDFPETENTVNSSFYDHIDGYISNDLIKLENQLPFFVLQGLFDLVSPSSKNNVSFEKVVHEFLDWHVFPSLPEQDHYNMSKIKPRDFVDFLSIYFVPSASKNSVHQQSCLPPTATELSEADVVLKKADEKGQKHIMSFKGGVCYNMSNIMPRQLVDFLSFYFVPSASENSVHQQNYLPPTATELSEAGVVFKKADEEGQKHIMSFKDGVLKIPPFEINDHFETYVRNLLAFEQFTMENCAKEDEESDEEINEEINEETKEEIDEATDMAIDEEIDKEKNKKNAINYFEFLDELITTEKDVRLLVKEGIIINGIGGSDEEIAKLFNDLCKHITLCDINSFSDTSKNLKDHCERRRNRWMASLKHNYFNTPWALISFLAATFVILLTLIQTIVSVISISK